MTASGVAFSGLLTGMSYASRPWRRGDRCGRALVPERRGSASPGSGLGSRDRCRRVNSMSSLRPSRHSRRGFRAQGGEYDFLSDFKLVVFDEAHRSVAPTFTSVMQDIGLTRLRRADEPFLLGLTATPYRGQDEAETARLAHRYNSYRLDVGAFSNDDPQAVIQELRDMGVLAQADHETIEGETFSADMFSPQELNWPWFPPRVEKRIAQSVERTRRIIEAYEAHVSSRLDHSCLRDVGRACQDRGGTPHPQRNPVTCRQWRDGDGRAPPNG